MPGMTWNPGEHEPRDAPQPPVPPAPAQYPPHPQIVIMQSPQRPTSTLATLSLVMGVLGFVTACCSFGVPSAAAVALGLFAIRETKDGQKGGHGAAIAGIVLGGLIVLPAIGLSIAAVFGNLLDNPPSLAPSP